MPERLQKILAQAGYGSRHASEEFIFAGRVRVNGQIASLGQIKTSPWKLSTDVIWPSSPIWQALK